MLCRICFGQIQPRKDVLDHQDHAGHKPPTQKRELRRSYRWGIYLLWKYLRHEVELGYREGCYCRMSRTLENNRISCIVKKKGHCCVSSCISRNLLLCELYEQEGAPGLYERDAGTAVRGIWTGMCYLYVWAGEFLLQYELHGLLYELYDKQVATVVWAVWAGSCYCMSCMTNCPIPPYCCYCKHRAAIAARTVPVVTVEPTTAEKCACGTTTDRDSGWGWPSLLNRPLYSSYHRHHYQHHHHYRHHHHHGYHRHHHHGHHNYRHRHNHHGHHCHGHHRHRHHGHHHHHHHRHHLHHRRVTSLPQTPAKRTSSDAAGCTRVSIADYIKDMRWASIRL